MSLIIKSGENKKQTNKQAYTWAACIMVSVFLVSIAVPFLGNKKEKTGQDYKERAYDLAQLPFSNDEATDALLFSDKYQDIGKKDLIGTLFSKQDKEKRKQDDKVNGVPAAPDPEYKAAEIQKENLAKRNAAAEERRAAASVPNVPTSTGSLRAGGMVSASGATSGVSANIWRSDDKERESGGSRGGSSSGMDGNKAQLLASIKSGRGTGFVDATMQSSAAAKNKNAEGAAAGAINAFQKGASDNKAEATTDLEKKAEELAIDPAALNEKLAGNTIPALEDSVKDKLEKKKQEIDKGGCANGIASSWKCLTSFILEKGVSMVASAGQSALQNKWGGDTGGVPKGYEVGKDASGNPTLIKK